MSLSGYYPETPFRMPIRTTPQSIKDNEQLQIRIQKVGMDLEFVATYLKQIFGIDVTASTLLKLAEQLCYQYSLCLDRQAKRNRKALLCWYCENWKLIQHSLPNINYNSRFNPVIQKFNQVDAKNQRVMVDVSDINMLLNYH